MLVCPGAMDRRYTVRSGSPSRAERLGCRQGLSREGNLGAPLGHMDHERRFRVARRQGHKYRADPSTLCFPI